MTRQLLSLAISLPPGLAPEAARHVATLAGRLGFSAIHLSPGDAERSDIGSLSVAAAPAIVVIDAPTPREGVGVVRRNDPDEVAQVRKELDATDATRPLLVAVPISIGRTMNEAVARADREPRFAGDGHPRERGIFGTFESAQEQVLALARAGADGLVLDAPLDRDVADVLAQIRSLVVGATPALLGRTDLDGKRSAPPPPPPGWGGPAAG